MDVHFLFISFLGISMLKGTNIISTVPFTANLLNRWKMAPTSKLDRFDGIYKNTRLRMAHTRNGKVLMAYTNFFLKFVTFS